MANQTSSSVVLEGRQDTCLVEKEKFHRIVGDLAILHLSNLHIVGVGLQSQQRTGMMTKYLLGREIIKALSCHLAKKRIKNNTCDAILLGLIFQN